MINFINSVERLRTISNKDISSSCVEIDTIIDIIIDDEPAKYKYWIDEGAIIISKDVIHRYLYSLFDRVDSRQIIPALVNKKYYTEFGAECTICGAKSCVNMQIKCSLCLRCLQYLSKLSKQVFNKFILVRTIFIEDIAQIVANIWVDHRLYSIHLDPFKYL